MKYKIILINFIWC